MKRTRRCKKVRHTTRASALQAARGLGDGLSPYRCPWCRHWHLTSKALAHERISQLLSLRS